MSFHDYTSQELMAITLSRELVDGEVGEMGAYSEIPMAACKLARLTHAPNLCWWCSASSYLNSTGPLYHSSTDYRNIEGSEAVLHMNEAFFYAIPHYDFFFWGGIQMDPYGNSNLTAIGDYDKPLFRGPGCAALPTVSALPIKLYGYMNTHTTKSFVEKLDFITGVGHYFGGDSKERTGIPEGGGPVLVASPLAVMDFDEGSKRMRLKSCHPGVTVRQVQNNTGFELIIPEEVPDTSPPTQEELAILREQVDPFGVLGKVKKR